MTDDLYPYLINKYGPLMSYADLGDFLRRSPNGLKTSLNAKGKKSVFYAALRKTRIHYGRRVYFDSRKIAELLNKKRV